MSTKPAPVVISDVNDFLNSLPAYDQSSQTDELLDLMRIIQESNNYYWIGAGFPTGDLVRDLTIGPSQTANGTINLTPGTYITAITHTYINAVNSTAGFKFSLYDKGSKGNIVYGQYVRDSQISSGMQNEITPEGPFGPSLLISPFIVNIPGILQWEIVNLDPSNSAIIQLMLDCAVPINQQSLAQKIVTKN